MPAIEWTNETYSNDLNGEGFYIFVAGICELQIDIYHLSGSVATHWQFCYHKQWIWCVAHEQTEWIKSFYFFSNSRMLQLIGEQKKMNVIDFESFFVRWILLKKKKWKSPVKLNRDSGSMAW